MKRKVLIFLLVMALAVGSASAQLGSGIVYDPTNYHNALLRYYQLQQHLLQLAADLREGSRAIQPGPLHGEIRPEHARPLPRVVFAMEERDLAEHLWEYRLLDQRHQFRPASQHQHRLPEVHNPTAPSTARTTSPAWMPVNLAACNPNTRPSNLPTAPT